ncbi:YeeE/YedE family protein [Senegalia massiliensis]|uniref:YeeE/YedE family protein n=1 Tax=Senegalia massiliensis TaxID=1720316 RepID=A0A845QV88_9CLOT|nr:YeeE/YedE family protein [Senegalia massiliensis]NBI06817.1 YeeE/YedE family protein [Senegalia massiliensis]
MSETNSIKKEKNINISNQQKSFNKKQVTIGIIGIILITLFGMYLNSGAGELSMFLITGVFFGYILTRSRFGFAGGIKRIYMTGEGSLTKALLVMFALTMIAMAGIHWSAVANGAEVIPGIGSVRALNLAVIVGGFIFGIGMMLAGGCASGTLTDLGEGAIRAVIALLFFVIGAVPGHGMRYSFDQSALSNISTTVYFPDVFGYIGAVLVSFALLGVLYVITRKYEDMRKSQGTYEKTVFSDNELPLEDNEKFNLFSYNTYHKLFVQRWSFLLGGLLLVIMFVFVINTTGKSWGVTSAFTRWGVALLQNFGFDFSSPAYADVVGKVDAGLLNDGGTIRNIGIIFGSALALLLAGQFKFDYNFKMKDVLLYALGGFMMGFGARFAKGCNIGALYSAISNFSLHGWGFLISLSLGGMLALKLFEGKLNIIPPTRHMPKEKINN